MRLNRPSILDDHLHVAQTDLPGHYKQLGRITDVQTEATGRCRAAKAAGLIGTMDHIVAALED